MTGSTAGAAGVLDVRNMPPGLAAVVKELADEAARERPEDLYQFCAAHFAKKLAAQRLELLALAAKAGPENALKVERVLAGKSSSLEGKAEAGGEGGGGGGGGGFLSDGGDDEFEEDEEEDEEEEEEEDSDARAQPPACVVNRGRRTSVSAESMDPTAGAAEAPGEKVVVPKTPEQAARIEAAIRNNFLFRNLDEEQYREVIDAMREKKVAARDTVIKQGAVGDYFYVTESGTLDVYVSRPPKNERVKVHSYGPQSSFGELALMYNAPRAATIITTSDCVLWALDRLTFRRILMDTTFRKRRYYESLLEEVPLLCSLEPYERHKIADALETVTYEDGEIVIRQGDIGENFYFIEQGDARVTVTDETGAVYELKGLSKGGYFGELALLHDKPRVATVTAKGRLKVATLGKKAFVRLLGPVVNIIKRNEANYESIQKRIEEQHQAAAPSQQQQQQTATTAADASAKTTPPVLAA
ncbi:MAG: cyclic nucleotide-binding-like protein [Olpidium bornovanus]|uniref:cAMP-dependent protein kinase regulatory subunit n=1 Tax=Olpidium bornovanus TaxID=278681 RepID=A0A8H7ZMQ3_9FUNG|nr:MAG: cyclic nucleotide-binding-like protein [Olpidium bornovanus]